MTWRAKHFGVWQELTSRITQMNRPIYFRDSMVTGVFHHFDHDHFFEVKSDGTLMRDVFDFEAPLGFLGRTANSLFLKKYMRKFLEIRNEAIKMAAETDIWKQYLSA